MDASQDPGLSVASQMTLVQKNVTVPAATWNRLRSNAQASGVPLCIYLCYLIHQSGPIDSGDAEAQKTLEEIECHREDLQNCRPAPATQTAAHQASGAEVRRKSCDAVHFLCPTDGDDLRQRRRDAGEFACRGACQRQANPCA